MPDYDSTSTRLLVKAKPERTLGWGLTTWTVLVSIFLVAPSLVVIPMSFSDAQSFVFPPKGWSLRWYVEFFSSPQWVAGLLNSLQIGVVAAIVSCLLGGLAAYAVFRSRSAFSAGVRGLVLAPIMLPGVIVAIALYLVFLPAGLSGTIGGFIFAHTALGIPYAFISISTALSGFDRTLETASASLGANRLVTTLRVTVPLLAPGILSGFVFAFVTSFEEVVVALFIQSPTLRTLPVVMYDAITVEIDPTIAAASSVIIVATTALLLLTQLRRPSSKKAALR